MKNGKFDWTDYYDAFLNEGDNEFLQQSVSRAFEVAMLPGELERRLREVSDIVVPSAYRVKFQNQAEYIIGEMPYTLHFVEVLKNSPLHKPYAGDPRIADLKRMGEYCEQAGFW